MKRIYIFILLCLLVINANAESVLIDGIYYNLIEKERIAEVSSNPNKYSGNVVIPSSVSYGGYRYTVTSIGSIAFNDCSGLTSLTIPSCVTAIGTCAFYGCSGLTSLTIPNSVTSIGVGTFYGCSGLTSLTIPNSVTSIGDAAFSGCSGLTSLTIPSCVTSIGGNAFYGCSSLTSLTIPNTVTSIGIDAFYGCSSLTSLTIPNSVTSIESYAFYGCEGLKTITIGSGIQRISEKAFASCKNVTDVYCHTTNVPQTAVNAFEGSYVESSTLHVPSSSISNYKGQTPWSKFRNITSIEEEKTYNLTVTTSSGGTVTYSGTTFTNTTKTFTVNEGSSATFSFTPNSGYRIGSVKINGINYTSYLSNNQYTINNVSRNTTVEVTFEAIPVTTYTLSISISGYGSVTYSGNTFFGATISYTVNEGTSATLTFTPHNGSKIGSLKVNGVDVTSNVSNNKYTISNITKNTTVSVTFEAIPPTTYTLSITSTGGGYVTYSGTTVNGTTRSYYVISGASAILAFDANSGYRIGSVKVNGADVTSSISSNKYTISNITKNTTVSVTFEAIPPTTYTLSITSTGGGYVTYSGTTVNGTTRSYTVNSGASATLAFDANSGYRIGSVKVNGADVTSSISSNKYTISNITKNTTVSVTFEAIPVTTYTLSISTSGNGSVTYSGNTINGNGATKSYSVNEGSSATFSFTPNSGYRIGSVKVNGVDVTSSVSNNKYTISNITKNATVSVTFEAIPPTTYTLSITSTGGGYVTYSGTTVNGTTRSYTVNSGASATLAFDANSGYRIGSVKVNGADVTSSISSNKYTISNITKNTTVSVTFEAIPPTTYTLSIKSSYNGSVTYSGNTINGATKSYAVNEGSSATFSFTPNSGYRIGSVKINGINYTSFLSNNQYTISNVNKDYTVEVVFEAIPTTYILSITSSGNGYVAYSGDFVTDMTKTYTVNEGTTVTLTFIPNSGYRMGNVKVNNVDVTSSVASNKYTISNINKNTTVSAIFEEIPADNVAYNGVNYRVLSTADKTVNVANGSYGQSLEIPASFAASGSTWQVRGMDSDVMTNNPQLAAIVWNPTVAFSNSISNPNFLLYVTSAQYAPSSVGNVIVNGTANSITLTEGNDFYCPQSFTAQSISYTHNYSMTTGIGECQGWETIALPFDVQTIAHATKGEIMPFAKWNSGDSRRPFWLYELTENGWQEAEAVKAYTPYVISMPNNDQYYDAARLNGNVTFSAKNVTVGATVVKTASYQGKVFTPNFSATSASTGIYALNVRNQWTTATNNQKEGSTFVRNLRALHPFEAYMSVPNYTRSSFGIFENMATTIRGVKELLDEKRIKGIYNLKGQKINVETDGNLPAGVYIINGRKAIVK